MSGMNIDPDKLTEEQKALLAMASGIPMDSEQFYDADGILRVKWTTKYPVGFENTGNGLVIRYLAPTHPTP